jgi:hypothetical protein
MSSYLNHTRSEYLHVHLFIIYFRQVCRTVELVHDIVSRYGFTTIVIGTSAFGLHVALFVKNIRVGTRTHMMHFVILSSRKQLVPLV